jgi:hypothetical protein
MGVPRFESLSDSDLRGQLQDYVEPVLGGPVRAENLIVVTDVGSPDRVEDFEPPEKLADFASALPESLAGPVKAVIEKKR